LLGRSALRAPAAESCALRMPRRLAPDEAGTPDVLDARGRANPLRRTRILLGVLLLLPRGATARPLEFRCVTQAQEIQAEESRGGIVPILEAPGYTPQCQDLAQHFTRVQEAAYKTDPAGWAAITREPSLNNGKRVSSLSMSQLRMAESLTFMVETILTEDVQGDFMESGVWTGGQSMMIAAVLKAHRVTDRTQWLCDSFVGLPKPNSTKYPKDAHSFFWTLTRHNLKGPERTQSNFRSVGLLDIVPQKWIVGFFNETMPPLMQQVNKLAMLRLDGDMYQSTWEVLIAMYPKVQAGGYVVIDDYNIIACRNAVLQFRMNYGITSKIRFPKAPVMQHIPGFHVEGPTQGAYWRVTPADAVTYEQIGARNLHKAFHHLTQAEVARAAGFSRSTA